MKEAAFLECKAPSSPPDLRLIRRTVPPPQNNQAQIEVIATSVNPIDVKRACGYGRRLLSLNGAGRFPMVLGNDVVGRVIAIGHNAGALKVGDCVMGALPTGPQGAHASHVNVRQDLVAPVVNGLDPEKLAAVPYSFTTLWLALRSITLNKDTARDADILINGASGALGQMATQLLVAWGARITAVCSTKNTEACRRLGATMVVDRLVTSISQIQQRYDFTLNFGAWDDEQVMVARLKKSGQGAATTCHPVLLNCDQYGLVRGAAYSLSEYMRLRRLVSRTAPDARYNWTIFNANQAAVLAMRELLTSGLISLPIGLSAPLEDGGKAFEHMAAGRPGRAILRPTS